MRVGCTKGLGATFDVFDIGNPVALASREARLYPFTVEACRCTTKERLIDTFEGVDADNRVKVVVDPACDDGHYAASSASVELCRSSAEGVLGYQRGILDDYLESAARIGGPHATVFGAKRAGAGTDRDFGGIGLPSEGEGDVSAVAPTVDQHACNLRVAAPTLNSLTEISCQKLYAGY
jgi:hypothetical protein